MSIELPATTSPLDAPAWSAPQPMPPFASDHESDRPTLVIEPPGSRIALNLGEVWRYRDLLGLLVWRDISANYRQSLIGIGWALVKPIVSMLIFTVIFGRVAGLPSDGVPYPIFSFAGLLPWMYFATVLAGSTNSVLG